MKLDGLMFADDANGDPCPAAVKVTMTIEEAMMIARVVGRMNGIEQNAVLPNGASVGCDIYDCLVGSVFNRYWDDGLNEAMEDRPS